MRTRILVYASLTAALLAAGCSWGELGNVAIDAGSLFDGVPAPPLPDGTPEPDGWSLLQWNTGGAIGTAVAAVAWLFRRSMARGFGRTVAAAKGLLRR